MGIVEGSCGYRGQYSGKIRFIEKPGVQDEGGGRHVAKHSSNPRVAFPEVNVQVRDLVRVVGIVAAFAPRGFSIRGKFVLSGINGHRRTHTRSDKLKAVYPYFKDGGMKRYQELYAKISYIPSA